MRPAIPFFLFLLFSLPSLAQRHHEAPRSAHNTERDKFAGAPSSNGFEENRGQLLTVTGEPAPSVRYRLKQGNTQVFLLNRGIAYQFDRADQAMSGVEGEHPRASRLETFRMDVELEGADLSARVVAEERTSDRTHYYNHYARLGAAALDVPSFHKVTYQDVYPGIDWVLLATEGGIEQDFVVHAGADPSLIRLRHTYQEELQLDANGRLVHGNRLGRFTEESPVSFQGEREVPTRFVLEGDVVRFAVGTYDRSSTLVIDPARVWGTYYGTTSENRAWDVATDAESDVYMVGLTASETGIAEAGHQIVYGGGSWDGFLVKFNANGDRLWATYYGGEADDIVHGCSVDQNGNVLIAGNTTSHQGIAFNGHQSDFSGESTAFLAKFDANGVRAWGTYYGEGTFGENATACAVDPAGNILLAGYLREDATGYTTAGCHQGTYGGGTGDAFLAKFTADGTRLWGTFYGGEQEEFHSLIGVATDNNGNAFLCGRTGSTSGIADAGHQGAFGGVADAFLVKFGPGGERIWGTYYGGSGIDYGSACATDTTGHVYLCGGTSSVTDIAANGHQNVFAGAGGLSTDGFLVKFDADGARQWGSYYGGAASDWASDCHVGSDGGVRLAGATNSADGIAFDGHQMTYAGQTDHFAAQFTSDGQRVWGTYYGGSGQEFGAACAIATDAAGATYLVGTTNSTDGIASNGYQLTLQGSSNAYLVKFACTADADADGVADCEDDCPDTPGVIGDACDDGDPNTSDDVINDACVCLGVQDCVQADLNESEPNGPGAADAWPMDTRLHGSIGSCAPTDHSSDHFQVIMPSVGGVRVEACLSSTGPDPVDVTFDLIGPGSVVVGSFTFIAGANGVPVTTSQTFSCRGIYDHTLRISQATSLYCTEYGITWSLVDPVFAADTEPNNTSNGTPFAPDVWHEGRIGHQGQTDDDLYALAPAFNGVMHIEVEAEHAGTADGTLDVALLTAASTVVQSWTVVAGANGVPFATSVSVPCRGATTTYNLRFSDITCGVSYRWRYSMEAPTFANDAEPNNVGGGSTEAYDTWYEGQIGFHTQTDDDLYNLVPPTNGVMVIEMEAEQAGDTEGTVDVALLTSASTTIQAWSVVAGASGVPVATTVTVPCRSSTTDYDLRFQDVSCGVSYRWRYHMIAPVFAIDEEPNNSSAQNTPIDLEAGSWTGQIGFDDQTDNDVFGFAHPGGPFSVSISAEHAGPDEGSLSLEVINGSGTAFGTFTVPVGGSSTPLTNSFTIPSLAAANNYRLVFSDVTCGVSYRINCATDADNDGICDVADLCPGGPEPGTPCDDGNAATIDDVITATCICAGDISTAIASAVLSDPGPRVWPNPTSDELWIATDGMKDAVSVSLRDMQGRAVVPNSTLRSDAQGRVVLHVAELAPGPYLLDVRTANSHWSERVVVVRR